MINIPKRKWNKLHSDKDIIKEKLHRKKITNERQVQWEKEYNIQSEKDKEEEDYEDSICYWKLEEFYEQNN